MALADVAKQSHCQSVILCSASAKEGATTAAVYIGRSLLRDFGFRPVLIEFNRTRPALARLFGLNEEESLAAVASGARNVMDCVQKDPTGLRMIPAGRFDSTDGLQDLESVLCRSVQALQNNSDFILVDAPPVLESADVLIAGRVIPNVILIVGSGRVSQECVREACRALSEAHIRLVGVILNERKRILPRWLGR